jgi:lipase chaperone LimK
MWGDQRGVERFVQKLTDTNEKLVDFVNKFIYQTHSAGLSDRVVRTHDHLAMKALSESLSLKDLEQRLSAIKPSEMSEERNRIVTFVLERIRLMNEKGLTTEQVDNSRFFMD